MKHHGGGGAEFPGSTPEKRNDCGVSIHPLLPKGKMSFGPFLIPTDYPIVLSGFDCPLCKSKVREIRKALPASPWTFVFKTCGCEKTVAHFVGDPGPGNAKTWKRCVKLAAKRGVALVILNLNPSAETSFGCN